MTHNVYLYILVMASVTYTIRMLPLVLIRKEITNRFIRSFLYYVPYFVRDRKYLVCLGCADYRDCTGLEREEPFAGVGLCLLGGVCAGVISHLRL